MAIRLLPDQSTEAGIAVVPDVLRHLRVLPSEMKTVAVSLHVRLLLLTAQQEHV